MALRKPFFFIQLPSPPFLNVRRDWQGGFGTADTTFRPTYGQDFIDDIVPFLPLLRSAALSKSEEIEIDYLDAQIKRLSISEILREIDKRRPKFIITVVNLPSIKGDLRLLKKIKEKNPKIKIITIGPVSKYLYKELFEDEIVDIAIRCEPEAIIVKLLNSLLKNKNKLNLIPGLSIRLNHGFINTGNALLWEDVSNFPFKLMYELIPTGSYRNSLFGNNKKFMIIFASKGCPYPCRFYCPYPHFYGEKLIFRPVEEVIDEIQYLNKNYGINSFIFRDQVFTYSHEYTIKLCREIIKRDLRVNWVAETRIEKLNSEILQNMKDAGCIRIHIGIENPNPKIFSEISKPGLKFDIISQKINLIKKFGISYQTHLIIGFPDESWETINFTKNFLKKLSVENIQVSIATPYPGTKFREYLLKLGLITCFDWSKYSGLYPVIKTKFLETKQLLKAKYYLESLYENPNHEKVKKLIFNLYSFTKNIVLSCLNWTKELDYTDLKTRLHRLC
jgi:radical SAM superfamily enzyme YgiQ (UPF0313 family)